MTGVAAPLEEPTEKPTEGKENAGSKPQTGDDAHMILWGGLVLAAMAGFAVLLFNRRKRLNI